MNKKTFIWVLVSLILILVLGLGIGYYIGKDMVISQEENKSDNLNNEIDNLGKELFDIGIVSFIEINYHDNACSYVGSYNKDIILEKISDKEKLDIIYAYADYNKILIKNQMPEDTAMELCGNFTCDGIKQKDLEEIITKYNFETSLANLMAQKDNIYYFKEMSGDCSNIKNVSHNYISTETNKEDIIVNDLVNIVLDDFKVIKETRKYTFRKNANQEYYLYSINNIVNK